MADFKTGKTGASSGKTAPSSERKGVDAKTAGQMNSDNNQTENKLSTVGWLLLASAAIMIDLGQAGLSTITLGTLGTIVNIIIDIFVGLSLFMFLLMKGMLDLKVGISVLLGFAADFLTIGIAPAWTIDIAYIWLVTDGAKKANIVPVVGEQAREAAVKILSKGKK